LGTRWRVEVRGFPGPKSRAGEPGDDSLDGRGLNRIEDAFFFKKAVETGATVVERRLCTHFSPFSYLRITGRKNALIEVYGVPPFPQKEAERMGHGGFKVQVQQCVIQTRAFSIHILTLR
jgi:hypothetical protein